MAKMTKALLDGQASVTVINSTDIVNEAIKRHDLSPVAAAALGRTLTMGSIMGAQLKSKDDRLTVIVNGGGELGKITVCSDSTGNVKGYVVNPQCETFINGWGKLDVGRAVGKDGTLTVIKDMGLKEPFNASVELVSGEIAEDFARYFLKSEQTASAVALGVLVDNEGNAINAAGMFISVLPMCKEETLNKLECYLAEMADVSKLVPVGNAEVFLKEFFDLFDVKIIEEKETFYKCDCSENRIANALRMVGEKECNETLKKEGKIEVVCRFCNKKYSFDETKIRKIFEKNGGKNENKG